MILLESIDFDKAKMVTKLQYQHQIVSTTSEILVIIGIVSFRKVSDDTQLNISC